VSFERDRLHNLSLPLAQLSEHIARIMRVFDRFTRVARERFYHAFNRDFGPLATTPERIDYFVARDRSGPGGYRRAPYPGTPLEMQSQQHLLHDIFRINATGMCPATNDPLQPNRE